MSEINVVAIAGSLGSPSRSQVLATAILAALDEHACIRSSLVELATSASAFAGALRRNALSAEAEAALRRVEQAELLVVATPVYRGSYAGLFKHFFDLVDQESLADVPVILAATGGSDRHALVIEHALRPLFSFFRAQTVPTTIYASDADFGDGAHPVSEAVLERAQLAARQAIRLMKQKDQDPRWQLTTTKRSEQTSERSSTTSSGQTPTGSIARASFRVRT